MVCVGIVCILLDFVMGMCVGVVVAWCVGVLVFVYSAFHAVSSGPTGSGGTLYGLELPAFLYFHARTP